MTALTLYGSKITSSTLASAATFASGTGGAETGVSTNVNAATTGTYLEIWGKGTATAQNAVTSLPAPTGNGWLFDMTTLEGQTISAGNWTPTVSLGNTFMSLTGVTIYVRFYKRSSGGGYTAIGAASVAGQSIATARTVFSLPAASLGAVSFATGDKLYVDLFLYAASNWGGASYTVSTYESSTTSGVASDMQVVTPGYVSSGGSSRRLSSGRMSLTVAATPLTLYLTEVAATVLTTADQIATAAGGALTSHNTTIGTALGYGEVYSQGTAGAWPAAGAIGAASGHGWILDSTLLEGQALQAGNYTPTLRFNTNSGSFVADIFVRPYVYNGGTYTRIGATDLTLAGQTITTTATDYVFAPATLAAHSFVTGDKLYFAVWLNVTSNSGSGTMVVKVSGSSSATQGHASAQIVTPGYGVAVTSTPMTRLASGRFKMQFPNGMTRLSSGRFKASVRQTRAGMGRFDMSVPTVSGLTLQVGGVPMPVRLGSIVVSDNRKNRSPATFVVLDPSGTTYTISERMRVVISTGALGTIFTGYVEKVEHEKAPGGASLIAKTVTCVDESYIPGKRYYTGPEIPSPQPAGDIVCDLVTDYLAAEGMGAPMARRRDTSISTFGQGTLSGLAATSVGLTLPASGTTYSRHETSTADFNTGTLTFVTSANNALELTPYTSMKIVGTAMLGGGGNLLSYVKFWNGSLTINSGDTLSYDIYVSTTSPDIKGGVDLLFSDGSGLRDTGSRDILGVAAHPATSLQGFADDTWYHRNLNLSEVVGRTVKSATLGLEGEKNGTYTYYVKNVAIVTSGLSVRATLFSSSLQTNQQIANAGYINVQLSTVTAYYHLGTRVSPVASLAGVGIIGDSLLSWASTPPVQTATNSSSGKSYGPPVLVESSFDNGATWQTCANHGAIPSLLPGLTATSVSILLRQTLTLGGPSPETTPQLTDIVLTVTSAAAAIKSDAVDTDVGSAGLTTGTLTNLEYVTNNPGTGLRIAGDYRNWDDGSVANQTMYSVSPNGANMDVEGGGSQHLRCDTGFDVRARLDFAGQWQDFVAEYDMLWNGTGNQNIGFIYRTTHWEGANLTYAFAVEFNNTGIELHYGSNSSSTGTNVTVAAATATWLANTWYHVKVVVSGTSHQISVNDYLYIDATSSQFNQTGYMGLRYYNFTGARSSGFFDNFGVQSANLSGTRITNALSLAAVGTVEDSAIEWNVTLEGTASLLVEASIDGGSTYLPCTSGAQIPGLTPGVNVSSKTLKLRQTFMTGNANMTPYLTGCSVYVIGNFSSSGTRVSPAMPLALAVTCGSSSLTWDDSIPTGATAVFATSLDGSSWNTVTNSGDSIAGLLAEGQPIIDEYATNTSAHYSSTYYTGGAACTPTYNTAISQLQLAGGSNALYVWNDVSGVDVSFSSIVLQAEQGGMFLRYTSSDNWYSVILRDSAASSNPQTVTGIKRVGGTNTTYQTSLPIDFVRGTYHRPTFQIRGNTLTFIWDGTQVFSIVDNSLASSGKVGYSNLSGTALWQRSRATVYGQSVLGLSAYSKVTLTSNDPRVQPVVRSLTETVRNPLIQSGALIPSTAYSYTKTIAQCLDDLALQSIGWWGLNFTRQLSFLLDVTTLTPDVICSSDLLDSTAPRVVYASPAYCNRQYVIGGKDLVPTTEQRIGNNYTLAWPLTYPIDSIQRITVNNASMLFGVQGTDTGRDYYYTPGSNILAQAITDLPLADTDVLVIAYTGQVQAKAMSENTAQQALIAALDNTTGIVESVVSIPNLTLAACQTKADALIAQNAQLARSWSFTTRRAGLASGQELTVFIPEFSLMDATFVITSVAITLTEEQGTVAAMYSVSVTDGPDIGHWGEIFIT